MYRGGPGVQMHPPSWANYFKIMQFFTRNLSLDSSFWSQHRDFLKSRTPRVKYLKFAPPEYGPVTFDILDTGSFFLSLDTAFGHV